MFVYSYAPLKKIRIKSCEQDISKSIKAGFLKLDIVSGNDVYYILREFHEKIDKVMVLCGSAHFDLVSKMFRNVLKLGS